MRMGESGPEARRRRARPRKSLTIDGSPLAQYSERDRTRPGRSS